MYSSISETSVSVLACVTSSKGCFWRISHLYGKEINSFEFPIAIKKKVVFVSFRGPTFTSHFVRYTMLLVLVWTPFCLQSCLNS